jgi:putative FmdB family regulatory protein
LPTYGYRCGSCGHEFETHQRITDKPLTECPKCGAKLSKKMYAAGVIFKGSGYYTTDYKGSSESSGNGSSTAGETSTPTETKSETKSEPAKADTKPEANKSKAKSGSNTEKAS